MGQYHVIVNVDKREKIHPHPMGCGLKQFEQVGFFPGAGSGPIGLLFYLLCFKMGRGGGDFPDMPNKGRWFGNRIVVLGDYAEESDGVDPKLYDEAKDITEEVLKEWAQVINVTFIGGDGWRDVIEFSDMRKLGRAPVPVDPKPLSPEETTKLLKFRAADIESQLKDR